MTMYNAGKKKNDHPSFGTKEALPLKFATSSDAEEAFMYSEDQDGI